MFGEKLLVSSLSFPNCVSGSISKINLKSSSPRNRKQRAREWIMEDMTFSFWLKERSIYFSSLEDTNWLILPFLCKRQSFSTAVKRWLGENWWKGGGRSTTSQYQIGLPMVARRSKSALDFSTKIERNLSGFLSLYHTQNNGELGCNVGRVEKEGWAAAAAPLFKAF